MLFLGILGIFQVFLLPGFILFNFLPFKARWPARLIAIVTSSLVINYCLVFLLALLGLYTRPAILVIMAVEFGAIIWQRRGRLIQPLGHWLSDRFQAFFRFVDGLHESFTKDKNQPALAVIAKYAYILLSLILAFIALQWIIKLFLWNIGTIFDSYDSIAQWNRWALHWSGNMLPRNTWRYPQLLPANWSIIYTVIGNTIIQIFAQSAAPVFAVFIVAMIVDLGFAEKNPGFFLGAAVTYLTFKKFLGPYVIEALADLPASFFAFSAVYLLYLFHQNEKEEQYQRNLGIYSVIAASGAAVTKQVGLAFLTLFAIMYFFFGLLPTIRKDRKSFNKLLLFSLAIVIAIVLPWYAYKQIQIWQGLEKSEVTMIIGATEHAAGTAGLLSRFLAIPEFLGKYFYLLLLILTLTPFVTSFQRALNLGLIFPLLSAWALVASYDFRNLSIVLPLFGVSSGLSIQFLVDRIYLFIKGIRFPRIPLFVVLIFITALIYITGITIFPDEKLIQHQRDQAMQAFSSSINSKVLAEVSELEEDFRIITNYPVENLPGLQGKKIGILYNSYEDYRATLDSADGLQLYLLVPGYADERILAEISKKIDLGEYELVFEDDSWIQYLFVKINEED